jgi:quinol monooxygenase YgiN
MASRSRHWGFCNRSYSGRVLVVTRFRVPDAHVSTFRSRLEEARAALAERPGYLDGTVGRNADDPELWVLATRWEGPGAYRRALSSYDVRVRASALLGEALDEPGAYVVVEPGEPLDEARPRHGW